MNKNYFSLQNLENNSMRCQNKKPEDLQSKKNIEILKNEFQNRDRYQSLIVHDLRTPSQSVQYGSETALELIRKMLTKNSNN